MFNGFINSFDQTSKHLNLQTYEPTKEVAYFLGARKPKFLLYINICSANLSM